MNLVDLLISLIPVIGQFADARDLAAYAYRIIFKKQYRDRQPYRIDGIPVQVKVRDLVPQS